MSTPIDNTKAVTEFVKSLVRPFIIVTSWSTILGMWITGVEPPPLLLGVAGAIAGEYIIERAKKRFKE